MASDREALIKHVGCGDLDNFHCCELCDAIRAALAAPPSAPAGAPTTEQRDTVVAQLLIEIGFSIPKDDQAALDRIGTRLVAFRDATADTARAQAFEDAEQIVEAIQTERGDAIAIATRKCEDEGECHYYAGEFNGLNEVLSKLRAAGASK